uniref:Putative secreted protein n=1 Tax=Ixodes scapularis TaxID=6945 RepID=A0A4D5RYK8_IXOSC
MRRGAALLFHCALFQRGSVGHHRGRTLFTGVPVSIQWTRGARGDGRHEEHPPRSAAVPADADAAAFLPLQDDRLHRGSFPLPVARCDRGLSLTRNDAPDDGRPDPAGSGAPRLWGRLPAGRRQAPRGPARAPRLGRRRGGRCSAAACTTPQPRPPR